jgi:UDP-N-acetylglucosamine:LPS N-acetylglucosamine transferase
MARAGAARVFAEGEWTGEKLYESVAELNGEREELARMGRAARRLGKPGAEKRAAEILLEIARRP